MDSKAMKGSMGGVESGGGGGVCPGYGAEEDSADVRGPAVSGRKERRDAGSAGNWAVLLGFGPCGEEKGRPSRRLGQRGEQAGLGCSGPKSKMEEKNPFPIPKLISKQLLNANSIQFET